MEQGFWWNLGKAARNLRKHAVSFEEAATAFSDPLSLTSPDRAHSVQEERFVLLGRSQLGRLLVVVHTDDGRHVRIISARLPTPRERRAYGESE